MKLQEQVLVASVFTVAGALALAVFFRVGQNVPGVSHALNWLQPDLSMPTLGNSSRAGAVYNINTGGGAAQSGFAMPPTTSCGCGRAWGGQYLTGSPTRAETVASANVGAPMSLTIAEGVVSAQYKAAVSASEIPLLRNM